MKGLTVQRLGRSKASGIWNEAGVVFCLVLDKIPGQELVDVPSVTWLTLTVCLMAS